MHYRGHGLPASIDNPSSSYCKAPKQFEAESVNDTLSSTSSEDSNDLNKPWNIHMFSASSTLHGFSHIFALHHSSLRKYAWLVAFVTSLTLFVLQVSPLVKQLLFKKCLKITSYCLKNAACFFYSSTGFSPLCVRHCIILRSKAGWKCTALFQTEKCELNERFHVARQWILFLKISPPSGNTTFLC